MVYVMTPSNSSDYKHTTRLWFTNQV